MFVQVAPLSFERQTPTLYAPAYTTPGCVGSTATTVAPRDDPKLEGNCVPPTVTIVGCASANVLPPSVDFHMPTPGPPGIAETAPAVVDEMPCRPRPSAT